MTRDLDASSSAAHSHGHGHTAFARDGRTFDESRLSKAHDDFEPAHLERAACQQDDWRACSDRVTAATAASRCPSRAGGAAICGDLQLPRATPPSPLPHSASASPYGSALPRSLSRRERDDKRCCAARGQSVFGAMAMLWCVFTRAVSHWAAAGSSVVFSRKMAVAASPKRFWYGPKTFWPAGSLLTSA
jgi:hypothetical protein